MINKIHNARPRVYPRWSMEKWQAEGQPAVHQVLREKTQSLQVEASAPEDPDELLEKGGAFICSFAEGKRV